MIASVREWADEDREDLAATGLPVFGSLEDLILGQESPGVPDAAAVAVAAGAAMALALRGKRARDDD